MARQVACQMAGRVAGLGTGGGLSDVHSPRTGGGSNLPVLSNPRMRISLGRMLPCSGHRCHLRTEIRSLGSS